MADIQKSTSLNALIHQYATTIQRAVDHVNEWAPITGAGQLGKRNGPKPKQATPEQRHLIAALKAMGHTDAMIARQAQLTEWTAKRFLDEPATQNLIAKKLAFVALLKAGDL